jgi:hypothetical protein
MLQEGTTFVFGSCVYVTDGAGNFHRHLVNNRKLEAPAATQCSDLNEFIDNLDEILPDLVREIMEQSIFDVTPTHAAPKLFRLDLILSEEQRTWISFELRNAATVYQKTMRSEFLSALEEDLDRLLKIGEDEATACWGAPILDDSDAEPFMGGHQGLMITLTPQGRFKYWKGKKPSELLGDDARLVAHLDTLPFQEGRALHHFRRNRAG